MPVQLPETSYFSQSFRIAVSPSIEHACQIRDILTTAGYFNFKSGVLDKNEAFL